MAQVERLDGDALGIRGVAARRIAGDLDRAEPAYHILEGPERDERFNAGVLLSCQAPDFLDTATCLDVRRLRARDPAAELEHLLRVLVLPLPR